MMNKLLLLLIAGLISTQLIAQEEVIVPQVNKHLKRLEDMRSKISWHLSKDELNQIDATIRKTDQQYYRTIWLSQKERFLIHFINGDLAFFRGLEKYATDYLETIPEPGYELLFFDDGLENQLLNYMWSNSNRVIEKFEANGAEDSEIDFARVFILRFKDTPEKKIVNTAVAEYVDDYPYTTLSTFVEEALLISDPPREWQYGLTFFTGTSRFGGDLGSLFPSQWSYGLTMDVYYGDFAFMINNQFTKPVNARREQVAGNGLWFPEARYKSYLGSLDFGYRFTKNSLDFTPFVGVSIQHIHTGDGEPSINQVIGERTATPHVLAFTYGSQIHIRLGGPNSQIALRLRVGRSDARFEDRYDKTFNGGMTFFNFGLGFL
ncbi:MAG: hypothetical protein ACRBF0_18250 [Calditrichia bacterium]